MDVSLDELTETIREIEQAISRNNSTVALMLISMTIHGILAYLKEQEATNS